MRKLPIRKNQKIVFLIVAGLLIIGNSIVLYKSLNTPVYENAVESTNNFEYSAVIDYEVFLEPNILYNEESIQRDQLYITDFIDYINTTLKFNFIGEREAKISGNYDITAVIEGYEVREELERTIWKKEYVLKENKAFNVESDSFGVLEPITIDLNEYSENVDQIKEEVRINSLLKLTIFWNIDIDVENEYGKINKVLTPTMVIPLKETYFEITGDLAIEETGSIDKMTQVEVTYNKYLFILYYFIIIFSASSIVVLYFFTKEKPKLEDFDKKQKEIFRKHGNRLVALNNEVDKPSDGYGQVKSIDDLVRIADEIGQPIMYKYCEDRRKISSFFVMNENKIFFYNLKKTTEDKKQVI